MNSVMDVTKLDSDRESGCGCPVARLEQETQGLAKRVEKSIFDAKSAVSEALEDGKTGAERLVKRSRHAIEDGITETAYSVKRNPIRSLAIAFAAGAAFAFLAPRIARK